jgi:hypothetical protein
MAIGIRDVSIFVIGKPFLNTNTKKTNPCNGRTVVFLMRWHDRSTFTDEKVRMKRSGTADLPLHGGHVSRWLAERMAQLEAAIVEQVVLSYGPSEFLDCLSDPFWFQALGCVMGMDGHSLGITASVAIQLSLFPE